ncbi:MAG: hypothetical protein KHZ90_08550 [Veillonella parvula]|uniref:Uncharacterized protein n=1 Tax=Veillonella parvula TaxID=29466 RepID=A0A942WNF1_VEIPA|nr:hypothetical protein [Veillonella parvula]MBS4893811.1 hypothetical protein [Veillonella parvula]
MKNILQLKNICDKNNIKCDFCGSKDDCKNFEEIINNINYLNQKDIGIIPSNWSCEDIDVIKDFLD